MQYTTETLYQYCETNNITLIKNYKDITPFYISNADKFIYLTKRIPN